MGLRIMFMANAPWCSTGYGVQGKHLVPRLRKMGHELAYFAFYGLQNGVLNIDGVPIYPMGTHSWGADILDSHMAHFRADVLISLLDVWVTDSFGTHAEKGGWAWCPWTPVDQEPVPQPVLDKLKGAHTVLPYAQHGEDQLRAAGVENVRYLPHAVDTTLFKPGDQAEARQKVGIPEDRFVIGMVAANKGYPSRKCFPENLLAFKRFKESHPDALLYLHTLKASTMGGIDFAALLFRLGLKEGEDVMFADQYAYTLGLPEAKMATLYQAFDCLCMVTMGEGFGIPTIEAQACGVPVIVANNTASTELCFSGLMVEKQHPFWTPLGSWAMIPDVHEIALMFEIMYDLLHTSGERERLAEQAREGAMAYDWDEVAATFWRPFLEELEEDIKTDVVKATASNDHIHKWGKTGLYVNGMLRVPCLVADCEAELVVHGTGNRVNPHGFSTTIDGIKLELEDHPDGGVAKIVCREIQQGTYRFDEMDLQPGDSVVDIGAHVGVVSIFLAKRYGVKVDAYEPVPENYQRLMRNVDANGVKHLVHVFPNAVAAEAGKLMLHGDLATNSGGMSVRGNGAEIEVSAVPMDWDILMPKLIKIDCEGAEYDILTRDALATTHHLVGEFHGSGGPELLERCRAIVPGIVAVTLLNPGEENERSRDRALQHA